MYLGAFHFDGQTTELLSAYERLMRTYPPESLDLHICIERDGGITVYDACPSPSDFEAFSSGSEFRAALQAAGLPTPRIEPLGDVYAAKARELTPTRA
jgi:hypothetical protein